MNAADTNVYLYALDADEPVKQAKAIALFDRLVEQSAHRSHLAGRRRVLESTTAMGIQGPTNF